MLTVAVEDRLEDEFRQILFLIKPYILRIQNQRFIEQYKIWLERLSDVTLEERRDRNKYLLELASQIQESALRTPFTGPPPIGRLPALKVSKRRESDWPFYRDDKNNRMQKRNKIKTFRKLGKAQTKKNDDSGSWCDLSGGSATSSIAKLASGDDNDRKTKHVGIEHELEGFKVRKKFLDIYEAQKAVAPPPPSSEKREVDALKVRMNDLAEVKRTLTTAYCLTEDRKKVAEGLQKRLNELESQNFNLKDLNNNLKRKSVDLQANHDRTIETLKKCHQSEMDELTKSNDIKIRQLEQLHQLVMKEKLDEIERLTVTIETLKKTQVDDSENQEVMHLKRCVSKMDKLVQKTEKDYLKKVEKLKQELELKDITMQMKLQTQKVELMFRNSTDRQDELNKAINMLEAKYKKMLQEQLSKQIDEKIHTSQKEHGLCQMLDSQTPSLNSTSQ